MAYLEDSRTFAMELFSKTFFWKNHKKIPVSESVFNEVIGLYPATILKERTPAQEFSDEFCEIVKTPLQNTSRQLLLFYGKIFYQ